MLQKQKSTLALTKMDFYVYEGIVYLAFRILKTALQQIKAPKNKIAHDTIESIVESKAKRKKTPTRLTKIPTNNNL